MKKRIIISDPRRQCVKRFRCKSCNYLSPAGYKVNDANCPLCKSKMVMGIYRQYKTFSILLFECN